MKKGVRYLILGLVAGCLMATHVLAQEMSTTAFDKLKTLEGEWEGLKSNGKTVEVSYKVVSNGSALIETLMSAQEPSMVTVYHQDGDKLMMTHYCSAGNQPRMKAFETKEGDFDFRFVDVTNIKNSSEGHMKGLKVIFVDENHFNQVWSWSEKGKETPNTFTFERKM